MSLKKSRTYSSEFKESAVKLTIESKCSRAQIARELGISKAALSIWTNNYLKASNSGGTKFDECLNEQVKKLKNELNRVTQERDLLKKAAAYFAKESQQSTRG